MCTWEECVFSCLGLKCSVYVRSVFISSLCGKPWWELWHLPAQTAACVLSLAARLWCTHLSSKMGRIETSPLWSPFGKTGVLDKQINTISPLGEARSYEVSSISYGTCRGEELQWEGLPNLLTGCSESVFLFTQTARAFHLIPGFLTKGLCLWIVA